MSTDHSRAHPPPTPVRWTTLRELRREASAGSGAPGRPSAPERPRLVLRTVRL